jgi:outer membrane receptor for ferric coprogen and ferric-rhodotorulic acid
MAHSAPFGSVAPFLHPDITNMKSPCSGIRAVVAALLASNVAFAQTAATSASTTETEDVVQLSPFEVHAGEDRGYVASETVTGTRIATQIKDLPYTINVVTSEFFEDFGMFQLDDTLTQVGGFTGLDVGGGFNLRGFTSTSQLRDGFYRLGRYGGENA